MSKNKTYSILVIVLLMVNMALLSFLILKPTKNDHHKRPQKHRNTPKNIIAKRLHFDDAQIIAYESLVREHRSLIRDKDDKITVIKGQLYQLLASSIYETTSLDSLTQKIATLQKEIEIAHFNHFKEIKTICKETQYSDYKELTGNLTDIFQPPHKKNRRSRGN